MSIRFLACFAVLCVVTRCCISGRAADENLNSLIKKGRGHLVQRNPGGAHAAFAAALQIEPDHEAANFLVALTRILRLPQTPEGSLLLDRLGFSSNDRNPFDWRSDVTLSDLGGPDAHGEISAKALSVALRESILPAIQQSELNLAKIANRNFEITLTSLETGLETVSLDYGDVLMLRAFLSLTEYIIFTVHGWNLDVQMEIVREFLDDGDSTLERLLNQHPDFLKFSTTADLISGQSAIVDFFDLYLDSSEIIRSRPQEFIRLFTYDHDMARQEAEFRQTVQELKDSLQQPVTLSIDDNLTVHLQRHFSGDITIRSLLPEFSGNEMLAGSLPDSTMGGLLMGVSRPRAEALLEKIGVSIVTMLDPRALGSDGTFEINFNTVDGHGFAIDRSVDLEHWEEIASFIADGETYVFRGESTSQTGLQFYRLRDLYEYIQIGGRVFDFCKGEPVVGAVISIDEDLHAAISDEEGGFIVQTRLRPGEVPFIQATITHGHYETYTTEIGLFKARVQMNAGLTGQDLPKPQNDHFKDRIVLQGFPVSFDGTACGATRDPGEQGSGSSVWFTWMAPQSGKVVVISSGVLAEIYRGSSFDSLVLESVGNFQAVEGDTYQIRCSITPQMEFSFSLVPEIELTIDSPPSGVSLVAPGPVVIGGSITGQVSLPASFGLWANGDNLFAGEPISSGNSWSFDWNDVKPGNFELRAQIIDSLGQSVTAQLPHPLRVRPTNDDFAQAIVIQEVPTVSFGSNVGATRETDEPNHGNSSVWWRLTPTEDGQVECSITAIESFFFNWWTLRVYSGSVLNELHPVESSTSRFQSETRVSFDAKANMMYYISLSGGIPERFHFRVQTGDVPGVVVTQPISGGKYESEEPITITASASSSFGEIESVSFALDGKHMYTDDVPPFETTISGTGMGIHWIQAVVLDSMGRTAFSEVTSFEIVSPPANDNFENAIPLVGEELKFEGSTDNGTLEAGEESIWGRAVNSSIWWCWTAPYDGIVFVSARRNLPPIIVKVFTGSGISDLSTVKNLYGEFNTQIESWFNAESGVRYWIAVAGSKTSTNTGVNLELDIRRTVPLEAALDEPNIVWRTQGDADWYGQDKITHDNIDAAESGALFWYGEQSILEASVVGPGLLSFWVRNWFSSWLHRFELYLDDELQTNVFTNRNDWQQSEISIPPGSHIVEWRLIRIGTELGISSMIWIDEVEFTPQIISLSIDVQPENVHASIGETVNFTIVASGDPPLIYRWMKDGSALTNSDRLSGTDTASLTIRNLSSEDSGAYSALVFNQVAQMTSGPAMLTVSWSDPEFDPGTGPDGDVYSLAIQADGESLVGGYFRTIRGESRRFFGRFDSDGSLNSDVDPQADGGVTSIAVQTDEKILISGYFTTLSGDVRRRIGRLNADGSLDIYFDPTPYSGPVSSLVVQADGKILIGGSFNMLKGQARENIGRVYADGTLDLDFAPGASDSNSGSVDALAIQADGRILVGGEFSRLGGQSRRNIGRLNSDGTLDRDFNPGADRQVYSLAVQPDGKILVGGRFSTLDGQSRRDIGRLNVDGTLDRDFNPNSFGTVGCLALQANGKIFIGDYLFTRSGQIRSNIGRLNADGTVDSGFNPGLGSGEEDLVFCLALQGDGKILMGGNFTTLDGKPGNHVVRLKNNEPATEGLAYNGSRITWLRGGSCPEVWRTAFETSTDCLTWVHIGNGTRILGGWQLSDVSLPEGTAVRARGFSGGSIYETVLDTW